MQQKSIEASELAGDSPAKDFLPIYVHSGLTLFRDHSIVVHINPLFTPSKQSETYYGKPFFSVSAYFEPVRS